MKYLILNQNTDNYGDDIAAQALAHIIRSADSDAQIRFLYGPRPWSGAVPVFGDQVSHRIMTGMGGKTAYVDLIRTALKRIFGLIPEYKNPEFEKLSSDLDWCNHVLVSPSGANIGIYQDWNALKVALQVVIHGKELIFHLNTVGRSGNSFFDLLARLMLRKSMVFVREARCLAELKVWGIHSRFGPDSAFALPARQVKPKRQKIIGLVPTGLNWHPDHQKSESLFIVDQLNEEFIDRFRNDSDLVLHIVPHLYGHLDECELLEKIRKALISKGMPEEQTLIANWVKSSDEYDTAIANCYAVITMRYHGVILAAKNGVPFYAISYESKMNEACRYTRMDKYCINVKASTPELLHKGLTDIFVNHSSISEQLTANAARLNKMTYFPIYQSIYLDNNGG